jgi:glutathione S-transferase
MTQFILHQYPTSPYAEIVRLAFGLKGLPWRRVTQNNIMPRPFLSPLTGGYRRIPVMQIGADIYCDTGMILREIERRVPDKPLVPRGQEGVVWALRNWAERAWFGATVAVVFGARADHVPADFIKDREELSGRPFDVQGLKAAAPMMAGQWRANAHLLEERLAAGGPYVLGDAAGVADLAAYLNIWFLRSGEPEAFRRLTADMPALAAWTARLDQVGHGAPQDMTPEEAFEIARIATPERPRASAENDAQGLKPGIRVSVMPDDYGRFPVTGEVSFVSPQEIALTREADGAGEVTVHFPRAGFWVMPA